MDSIPLFQPGEKNMAALLMENSMVIAYWSELPLQMRRFMIDLMKTQKVNPSHAEQLADVLLEADIRGHYSHGLNRLGKLLPAFLFLDNLLNGQKEVIVDFLPHHVHLIRVDSVETTIACMPELKASYRSIFRCEAIDF
ncbi:unnamed protein product [Haemonchus placei]|uniref:NR LBD domain-containing protein n=1 Tax=Haemonchus placei TaxID=6290 RepID=A0A0N4WXW2_HAEPC|nr:unnamed protein product [Haemonchus placei]